MWRSATRAALILLLGICVVGVAATDAQEARLAIAAALLPWMLFLVWHGVKGRQDLLWLALFPFGLAAAALWGLAPYGNARPQLFPMRGLTVVGSVTPEAYTLKVGCEPLRGSCSTAHELILNGTPLELSGHSVEPSRRGWLVREAVLSPLAAVRLAQLPAGSAPQRASGDDAALLAVSGGPVCVALDGLPLGAFLDTGGDSAAARVERVTPERVRVTWCADTTRQSLGFAYVQPPWQGLARFVRPFQELSAAAGACLAALLSVAAVLVRWRR
jgi:hypothetical protein